MAAWRNDDLMLSQAQRDLVESSFPGYGVVFDFPELRALFEGFDSIANKGRRQRQRNGLRAIMMTAAGSGLSAALPIVELATGSVSRWAFALAAALIVAGALWASWLLVSDRHKAAWLEQRLHTERLRQFYFQQLLSDPALAAAARTDKVALGQWQEKRRQALALFTAWLAKPADTELRAVIADVNLREAWLQPRWLNHPPLVASPDLEDFFELFRRQRLGVQAYYVREKTAPGIASPISRLKGAQNASWLLTLATLALTTWSAVVLFMGATLESNSFVLLVSLTALAGVASTLVRVVSEGLQLRTDCDRYSWYADAIKEFEVRIGHTDLAGRMKAYQEFERITYREMREFLKTHEGARFSFM